MLSTLSPFRFACPLLFPLRVEGRKLHCAFVACANGRIRQKWRVRKRTETFDTLVALIGPRRNKWPVAYEEIAQVKKEHFSPFSLQFVPIVACAPRKQNKRRGNSRFPIARFFHCLKR